MSTTTTALFPPPLDTLSADDQYALSKHLQAVRFEAGATIFRAGDEGDGCYLIDEGEVRLEIERPELDTEGVLGYLTPGMMLGELALLDAQPRSASAFAETDVEARFLSAGAIRRLSAEHPRIATTLLWALARDVSHKLRATTMRLTDHLFTDAEDPEVDEMVARAVEAQQAFEAWPEERVDALLLAIAQAVAAEAESLAQETVEETHFGNVADKTLKNQVASLGVYQSLAGKPGRGLVGTKEEQGVIEIASPAGIVFGMVPVTNPVATAVFKTLIALKSRNALILSYHRGALGVGNRVSELMRQVIVKAGAPEHLVQWIRHRSSRKKTAQFMTHPDVSIILATGGSGMVKAAYSSGTPAIGVGPGNAPCWITASAEVEVAAQAVVHSKAFDNGLICGAEHNLVVDASVRERFVEALEAAGAAVLSDEEARRFTEQAVEDGRFRVQLIGQDAQRIAGVLKIERDHPIRILVIPTEEVEGSVYAGEKMAPVLSLFTVAGEEEGMALCKRLLRYQGAGHTAAIHSTDEALIERFGVEIPASRILVNTPAVQGVVGLTTGLEPSFTLGCGTFGNNSTTDNVTYRNLQNVKRLAHHVEKETPASV